MTNNHVIAGATAMTVQVDGAGHVYVASVVGTDPTDDVAVLQLQHASGLPTVRATGSASPAVGDPVTAVGNALGQPGPLAVVTGVVEALDQTITVSDPSDGSQQQLSGLIQTDAPLQPGDSGGPLLDASGVVIGMDTAASSPGRYERSAPEGFAIPMTGAGAQGGQGRLSPPGTALTARPHVAGAAVLATGRSAAGAFD